MRSFAFSSAVFKAPQRWRDAEACVMTLFSAYAQAASGLKHLLGEVFKSIGNFADCI
jgi:hypothetical protein